MNMISKEGAFTMAKVFITLTGTKHYFGNDFLEKGTKIRLEKEPDNEYDKEAIKVIYEGLDCQHFFRQIFLGYFSDIVQAFDTLRKNVCGDDYTSLHNPIVLSSVLPAYGMFHSIQILFL